MQIEPDVSSVAQSPMSSNAGYWDYGGEREPLMHRIHAYPAKFPAFIKMPPFIALFDLPGEAKVSRQKDQL